MGITVSRAVAGYWLAFAVICLPFEAGAEPADNCSALPKSHMRVHVTAPTTLVPDAEATIRQVVTLVWAREGIAIDWLEPNAQVRLQDVDAWILARHEQRVAPDPRALGAVYFTNNAARPLIRISIDAVIAWIQRDQTGRRGMGSPLGPFMSLLPNDGRRQVARMLGYVAAHELGHLWLGTQAHASIGLMRASYRSPAKIQADPTETLLDKRSQKRLATRLAAGAQCR